MDIEQSECALTSGRIGWNELATSDPAAAINFYTKLFGWETEDFPLPTSQYTLFKHGGKAFGGVLATPQPGAPTQWINYVIVTDIMATLAQCRSLGGKICVEPIDIPGMGRIAIIQDPQGATIGLHQGA